MTLVEMKCKKSKQEHNAPATVYKSLCSVLAAMQPAFHDIHFSETACADTKMITSLGMQVFYFIYFIYLFEQTLS